MDSRGETMRPVVQDCCDTVITISCKKKIILHFMEFRNEFTYPISSFLARLVIHNNTESAAFAALSTTGTPVDAKYEPDYGAG